MKTAKKYLMILPALLASLTCWTYLYAQSPRGGGGPIDIIPEKLRELDPKDYFIASAHKKIGVIHALSGIVIVLHRGTNEAYFGREGDTIFEHDALNTLSDSRCRIKFYDEDLVTMAENTEFAIEQFEDRKDEGKKNSLFSMVKGKAMFYALRLFGYTDIGFRLQTPTAVVGVRGTKFGAHVYWLDEEKRGDLSLRVADAGNEIGTYLVQADKAKSFTDAFSVDGIIDVVVANVTNSVFPGNMFNGSLGTVMPTPPQVLRSFERETSVGAPAIDQGAVKEGEALTEGSMTIDRTVTEETAALAESQTETLQKGTAVQTELGEQAKQVVTYNHGYFSAMLTNLSPPDIEDVFISLTRQPLSSPIVKAESISDSPPTDRIASNFDNFGSVTTNNQAEIHSTDDIKITDVFVQTLNFLQYGAWQVSDRTIEEGGLALYEVVDYGWWVKGQITPDAAMTGFSGSATYSGSAQGTFYNLSPSQTQLLNGNFQCGVNFNTGSVTNFNIDTQSLGASHTAKIIGASGSFTGSQFQINPGTGSWLLDGSSASYKAADGSLFGDKAQEIGGVWGMKNPGTSAAAGIFAGSKQ